MMDIQKSREEFGKLPEIAEILNKNGGGYYKEHTNDYHHCNLYFDKFLNGAWYVFQEQQKQIDEIKAMAESWINQDYTYNSDSTDIKIQQMKDCGRDIIRKINGE